MYDIYGDLENYQFDNIVSELKNENEELKCKLGEYASTVASLQKNILQDFDKLSSEYKKLEQNYSSLLKTARAEIERKSQMITNLNIEKDKLVIEAMLSRGRIPKRNNYVGNEQQTGKQLVKEDMAKKKNYGHVPDTQTDKSFPDTTLVDQERKEEQVKATHSLDPGLVGDPDKPTHSLDPGLVGDPDNIIEKDRRSKKADLNKDKEDNKIENKKSRENHSDYSNNGDKTSADKTIASLDPCVKETPGFEKNETKTKKCEANKDKKINKNEIRKNKDKNSDAFDNGEDKDTGSFKDKVNELKKYDSYRDKDSNKNETAKNKDHDDFSSNIAVTNSVRKIRNRRKSMPVFNRCELEFSSDEDRDEGPRDYRSRRKSPLRTDRTHYDKYRDQRKVPDLIRMRDKHNYDYTTNYDTSREVYRQSNNWNRENGRHKNSDNNWNRYEQNQRSRRYHSPNRHNIQEEYYSKPLRESNDRPHRFDNVRQRTLVSPPPERYSQHRRSRELDGQRFQNDVGYPMKHKLHDVMEEPVCKRPRSESINKPPDKNYYGHDRIVEGRANSLSKPLELSYLSLQSPDHLDNLHPVHQIKEIRATSDTKLDDPRLKSKKYIVNTHNDKTVLSTAVGRNVDIKNIDLTNWNIKKDEKVHEMPALLREKPPISEDYVKEIYMDVDNPLSNLSLESGEICLDEETSIENKNKNIVPADAVKDVNNKTVNNNPTHDQLKINNKEEIIDNEQKSCPTLYSKRFRIPKIKREEESSTNKTVNKEKKDTTKQTHKKKNNDKKKRALENKLQTEDHNDCDSNLKMFSHSIDSCENKKHSMVNLKQKEHFPENPLILPKGTVEGDLELSDETCDYEDDSEETKYNKGNNEKPEECNKNTVFDRIYQDINTEGPEKSKTKIYKNKIETPGEHKHFNVIKEVPSKESISETTNQCDQPKYNKKNKVKNAKSNKNHVFDSINKGSNIGKPETSECLKDKIMSTCENQQFNISRGSHDVPPKEATRKPCKEQKTKDIKSKLCDLFGDTSSLITLDDLGIAAPTNTKENLPDYAPLFENTQDAVDLNIEDMEKVQTRSMKDKNNEDEPIVKDVNKTILGNIDNVNKNCNKREQQKVNNVEKNSSIQRIFENVNAEPDDKAVVKTVIISTGVQNNCQSAGSLQDGQGKQSTVQGKNNDNVTSSTALNIKALATSTPYKPPTEPLPLVPEVSCSSNNSTAARDASISSNTEENSKVAKSNLDIPDLRIIVKRRRKGKGGPA